MSKQALGAWGWIQFGLSCTCDLGQVKDLKPWSHHLRKGIMQAPTR